MGFGIVRSLRERKRKRERENERERERENERNNYFTCQYFKKRHQRVSSWTNIIYIASVVFIKFTNKYILKSKLKKKKIKNRKFHSIHLYLCTNLYLRTIGI